MLAVGLDALLYALCSWRCDWSVRLELHQHLPGYEPDALTVKLQTNESGRIPRCCPGPVLVPNQASSLALSYPMKLDVRPRLALGNAVLRTAGSALCLAHDDEIGSHSRIRTGTASFTTRNAAVTICGVFEMEPPVRFALT